MPKTDTTMETPNQATISRKAAKVKRTQKQWMAIFEAQRTSGMTAEGFCKANHISRSAYWKWRKQFGTSNSAATATAIAPTFIPIPITVTPTPTIELELGALRIRCDGTAAQRVMDAIVQRITPPA